MRNTRIARHSGGMVIAPMRAGRSQRICMNTATMNEAFKERHDYLVGALNETPGFKCLPAAGTFYAFPDVSGAIDALPDISGDIQLAEHLLENAEVAVVPGSAFGAPGHLRLSFACGLETLETAVDRIREALS